MARLTTRVCSLFNEKAIIHLRTRKIFTFVDFLREDPEKLVKICHLPYPEIMIIRRNLISHYSAFPKTGLDAYHELLIHSALIPFGVPSLDNILDGGLLTGTLSEIYGSSSTGKTRLCFSLIANVALNLKQQVHYIDAKGGFSGKSLRCMFEDSGCSLEAIEEAQKNVVVTSVKCINELLSLLYHLRGNLNQDCTDGVWTRLVIIDSLPPMFYQFIGEASNRGLGLMNSLATILKSLAVENRVVILTVNLPSKGSENEELADTAPKTTLTGYSSTSISKPALGNYWFHVPNLRLFVRNNGSSDELEVTITRSTNVQFGKQCKLTIGRMDNKE